jgi:hypothetical protein
MKNLLVAGLATAFFLSCNLEKNAVPKLSDKEAAKYSIKQDTVYREDKRIAYLNLIEWEYYEGKLLREISLVQFDRTDQGETLDLISFIRRQHPDSKIEVKFKEDN